VEEENGDILNDSIYKRNLAAMEKYNFTMEETITSSDPSSTVSKNVMAGEDVCDIALLRLSEAIKIDHSILYNLMELPNLDLNKLYWDHNIVRDIEINGYLPYITGDILVSDDDSTMVNIYNRPLADDYGIENLYDVVHEGTWTVDKMLTCMRVVIDDLDGNGIQDEHDRYGLIFVGNSAASSYFGAFDVYLFEKDTATGTPVFTGNSERAHTAFEKMNSILSDNTLSFQSERITENAAVRVANMLGNKQVLFLTMVLSIVRRNYRDVELNFGILPIPKFEEYQPEYGTIVNLMTPFISVPATVASPDTVGFILEALAAESTNITEAYYTVNMESKYTRDKESFDMIELARQNITYDLGFVYAWGGLSKQITNTIMSTNGNYASLLASLETKANTEMEMFLENLQK